MASIFEPRCADELRDVIAWAVAEESPIDIRGAGTKRGFGRPADSDAVIKLGATSGISYHEPGELALTAGAATPLADIESRLSAEGQWLAFEPPDYGPLYGAPAGAATIGGVLGCNLSGPRRPKSGAARDHFLGVKAVSGRGETFKSGGRVVKNVTGYDICKLLCGSFGTLAVMTEVTVKVLPAPETSRTVVVNGVDAAAAIRAMGLALSGPHDVSGAAHFPEDIAGAFSPAFGTSATALRIEGGGATVPARVERFARALADVGECVVLDDTDSRALWRSVRNAAPFAQSPGAGSHREVVWRLSVPPADAARVAGRISGALEVRVFYDWAGGLVWVAHAAANDLGFDVIRTAAGEVGGSAILLRAEDDVRARVPVFQPQNSLLGDLTRRLKESFDPKAILNRGRMYAGV